ncbi:MAG: hypothetical protein IJG54_00530 [Bacteroidales bacterium]|nr:hypothetical protein [Bacteroidales bacterium]
MKITIKPTTSLIISIILLMPISLFSQSTSLTNWRLNLNEDCNITAYIISGEILNTLQKGFGLQARGEIKELKIKTSNIKLNTQDFSGQELFLFLYQVFKEMVQKHDIVNFKILFKDDPQ